MFANATTEQLAGIDEILQHLDELQIGDPNANRRRSKRVTIRASMSSLVLMETGEATLKLFTRNISTSGIGFVSRRLCKTGERMVLSFDLPGRPRKIVLAKVTFCRYVRAGLYDAGAEFMECIASKGGSDRIPAHWMPVPAAKAGNKPAPAKA